MPCLGEQRQRVRPNAGDDQQDDVRRRKYQRDPENARGAAGSVGVSVHPLCSLARTQPGFKVTMFEGTYVLETNQPGAPVLLPM